MRRPAPRLGEHNAGNFARACRARRAPTAPQCAIRRRLPQTVGARFSGVRVLDFCWVWAGPFCTLQLAHLGAEVIRVETGKRPCINRVIPPYAEGKPGLNRAGSFNQWNQGKRSLQLDLSKPRSGRRSRVNWRAIATSRWRISRPA